MSKISIDIPTIKANAHDFENLIQFLHKYERILKQYGGIKIKPHIEFQQSLKTRRTNFPSCSNVQYITQISKDELIYSIKTETCKNKLSIDESVSINENLFWQSLSYSNEKKQQRSNINIFPNKSFYSTRSRPNSFDLHRLPKLSLLKIGGSKILRHCVPSLVRAYGPGAIFPLSSAHHRLFSIDYHHEGGNRQWYIIPYEERQQLEQILKRQNSSICLEHKNLLINPSVFDKYHIRYHRLIQHSNEFVVLAAGALAQGFAENASWNETITFALPSWLQDGHATAQKSLCNSCLNRDSIPEPIDISQFRYEIVQKWTNTNLNFTDNEKTLLCQKDHNNTKINMPITPIDNEMDLLDEVLDEFTMNTSSIEPFWQNNQQNTFLTEPIISSSNQYLPNLLISPISNCSYHDEKTEKTPEKQSQVVQNNSIDSDEIIQSNNDQQLTSFDLMDFLPINSINSQSTQHQTNEQINIHENNKNQRWNSSKINLTRKIHNQTNNIHNTLYVSHLNSQVCKMDLYRHFVGSIKITLKQHQMPPYLKYAFVVYRTHSKAEYNRRRPINYHLFGSQCRVEYAEKDFHVHYEQQPFTIVVTRIPENVTENELRNLFVGCQSLKYYPGRAAHFSQVKPRKIPENKILLGYAFLQYSNSEQATSVVENSDQYRINGQPLNVSFYTKKKSSLLTMKK